MCALDWETIARGPALLDLAALTAGAWDDRRRAARRGVPLRAARPAAAADFAPTSTAARLLTAARWLAAPAGWRPPPEQARDWLRDAEADRGKDPRMSAARRLIVNADDFGLSAGVNRGIAQAHEQRDPHERVADGARRPRDGGGRLRARASAS